MEFNLDEKHKCAQKMAKEFTIREVMNRKEILEKNKEFPSELLKKMADYKLLGIIYPKKYGGNGDDAFCGVLSMEEIARASASLALTLNAHWLAADAIAFFGNHEQKEKYLLPMLTGKKLAAFAYTELTAGSDAAGIKATGILTDNKWLLNGIKAFCTNGMAADIYVVAVRTGQSKGSKGISTFIIEKGTPGFIMEKTLDKIGCQDSITAQILLQDCIIPTKNLLGSEGEGFKIAMSAFDGGRINIGAIGLGIMAGALNEAVKIFRTNKNRLNLQYIQAIIADMSIGMEATRVLVYRATELREKGYRYTKEAAMAKAYGAKMAVKTTKNLIQILGYKGYTKDFIAERLFRDALLLEIGEGTTEILCMLVGGLTLRG